MSKNDCCVTGFQRENCGAHIFCAYCSLRCCHLGNIFSVGYHEVVDSKRVCVSPCLLVISLLSKQLVGPLGTHDDTEACQHKYQAWYVASLLSGWIVWLLTSIVFVEDNIDGLY